MEPKRKIPLQSRSVRGFYTSHRWPRPIAHESNLERDYVILCDFDREVRTVVEQPCRIAYVSQDGKDRIYTPDFYVEPCAETGPPRLVEIKYQQELDRNGEDYAERFKAAEAYAGERGWRFIVQTERDIRTVRLSNAKFLLPYLRNDLDHGRSARWLNLLKGIGRIRVTDALEAAWESEAERLEGLAVLWQLAALGRVSVDTEGRPLGLECEVWVVE